MNIKLDSTGDIAIEDNLLVLISGGDEIAQLVNQRLKTFYGECFLNDDRGVPYFQQILVKGANPSIVYALIQRCIIETDGVLELQEFDAEYDKTNRSLAITGLIKAEDNPDLIEFSASIGV